MLKIRSLGTNEQFKKLLKLKKIHNNYFTIYFGKIYSNTDSDFKISVVAKKKIGNAVKRNKIKRRLKSAVQKNLNKFSKKNTNYGYLLIAKSESYNEKFSVLNDHVDQAFKRITKIIN